MDEEERLEAEERAAKAALRATTQKKAPKKNQTSNKQAKQSKTEDNRGKPLEFDDFDE